MFAINLLAVPNRRHTRYGIEIFHTVDSRYYLVMIAANQNSFESPRPSYHFIRIGAITDDVPEVDGCIGQAGAAARQASRASRLL